MRAMQQQALLLNKSGISKMDTKTQYVAQKYLPNEAIEALDKATSAIKSRQKKKGEVQTDEDLNGIKNFPKLSLKLLLEHEYLSDLVKANQILAELDKKQYLKSKMQVLGLGALSTMASKVVSKGQTINEYKLPDA